MSRFIEELYYGNIEPQEYSSELSEKLKKKLSLFARKEELLISRLSDEEGLFLQYASEYNGFLTAALLTDLSQAFGPV